MQSPGPDAESPEQSVSRMVDSTLLQLSRGPNYPRSLVRFAQDLARKGHEVHAFRTARKALVVAPHDVELGVRVRAFLSSIVPGYHLTMINDQERNEAWDRAIRQVVRPGMRVLEIGSGPGLLALMAARAGASKVVTCEFNPVVAALAREIVAQNGYADRIEVVGKSSFELAVGVDLDERADLLLSDNFSDDMFSFEPLRSIADARLRLLKSGAPSLPCGAAVRISLADWKSDARFFRPSTSVGFDISPAAAFVPDSVDLEIGDAGMTLMSDEQDVFRFDFNAPSISSSGRKDMTLEVTRDGVINGIVQWIRLELTSAIALEARPRPQTMFFSNPRFYPFPQPQAVQQGDVVCLTGHHDGRKLLVWAREQDPTSVVRDR